MTEETLSTGTIPKQTAIVIMHVGLEASLFFHSAYGVCRLKLELPLLVSLAVSRHLMKKDERVNSIEERSVHHHVLL